MDNKSVYNETKALLNHVIELVQSHDCSPISRILNSLQYELEMSIGKPNLNSFCAFAEKVVGWIPLNPNDLQRVKALVSTYYIPGYGKNDVETLSAIYPHQISEEYNNQGFGFIGSDLLPSKDGFISLFNSIAQDTIRSIGILGRRGSGKTVAVNFFLATAHHHLSEKGIIWFRTDIAKLYSDEKMTLLEYTIIHSIYVCLRYSKEDINLNSMKDNGKLFSEHLKELEKHSESIKEVYSLWKKIIDKYENILRRNRNAQNRKPVSEFMRSCKYLINEDKTRTALFEEIYMEMISFIRENVKNEGRELSVLIIIDGVDNIRINADQDKYHNFLKEILELISSSSLYAGDKFIVVARPETFDDMRYIDTAMLNGETTPAIFKINIDIIDDLLKKKSNAIEYPAEYFKNMAKFYTSDSYYNAAAANDFTNSINALIEILRKAKEIDQRFKKKEIKSLDLMFDGNIRSLLRNTIRAHQYKTRLSLSKIGINRLLFEGSVLAGCNFLPPTVEDRVYGQWCPNLFGYATIDNGHWSGLMMIRIIQLLSAVDGGVMKDDAINFLNEVFGYDKAVCNTAFQAALEYSLIRAKGHRIIDENKQFARPIKARKYITTEKGHYIIKLTFSDDAIFYFMSNGTPVDLERLKNAGINLELFIHSNEQERHFYRAAILSGLILWSHIDTANRREKRIYDKAKCINNEGQYVQPKSFDLPDLNEWPKQAINLLIHLHENDLNEIKDTLERYKSTFIFK